MRLLIAGCGYVGCQFAKQWQLEREAAGGSYGDDNDQLVALTRSHDRAAELSALGLQPLVGDWLDQDSLQDLPSVDGLLVAIPHRPAESLGASTHIVGLKNLLNRIPTDKLHVVYLSTTGVYGQDSHDDVDELTPVSPTRPGPEVAVAAERWLLTQADSGRFRELNILRLAGIYGRGRIPLIQSLLAGEPLAVPRDGHLNLIHVVDIGRLLVHTFRRPLRQRLYVVSDGVPVRREEFYCELASLCGVTHPTFVPPAPNDARVRRATDKRINPQRLMSEWRDGLEFPNYAAGLADAAAERS